MVRTFVQLSLKQLLIGAWVLSACHSQGSSVSVTAPTLPSITRTTLPAAQGTQSSPPSNTPRPPSLLEPADFPTPTPAPIPTPGPAVWTSPDGTWLVESISELVVNGTPSVHFRLRVTKADGSTQWTIIDQKTPVAEQGVGGHISSSLTFFKWSSDGQSVYLIKPSEAWGDGCIRHVANGSLSRVDLSTGRLTEILPPVALTLALSPNDEWLAYTTPDSVILRNLDSGTERQAKLPLTLEEQTTLWWVTWSPDTRQISLSIVLDRICDGWSESRVYVTDMTTLKPSLLFQAGHVWQVESWPEPDRLVLRYDYTSAWWLDTRTRAVKPVSSTSMPPTSP